MNISAPRILLAGLLATSALAAMAHDLPVAVAADEKAKVAASPAEADNQDRIADRHCLRATGSRIVVMRNANADQLRKRCAIGTGRVHTSEDLERTGATSLGEALRRLEPSTR